MNSALPSRRSTYSLGLAFLVAATAAFLGMRWNMLESRWEFPMGTKVMLSAAVVAAALSRMLGKTQPRVTILAVGAAVPAGAFAGMVVEMFKDPTAQNLWPVSVIVLALFALAASSVGTLIGGLALRLFNGQPHTESGR